jgi:hypothetical protein
MYLFKLFIEYEEIIWIWKNVEFILWCLDNQYIAGFYSTSYIKHLPLQPLEDTERFKIELWFLSESSSGKSLF